jgi:hypothetical protein
MKQKIQVQSGDTIKGSIRCNNTTGQLARMMLEFAKLNVDALAMYWNKIMNGIAEQ